MHICNFICFLGLSLIINTCLAGGKDPPLFNATYKLYNSGMEIAQMERKLLNQGAEGYLYSSITDTIGIVAVFHKDRIVEETRWTIVDDQLHPLHYSYLRSKGKKNRKINIEFDWANKIINNVANNKLRQMPLQPGILDKLLYQYALMRDLKNNPAEITYEITDGGKLKQYYFARGEEEIIQTPLGAFPAVKLQKIHQDDKSQLIIWAAPSLEYLPVKVEFTDDDGSRTTAVIQALQWL